MSNNHLSSNALFTRGVFRGDTEPNIEYWNNIMILTLTDQLPIIYLCQQRELAGGEIS